jgi:phosphotransferase system HPr-like phosphotransfer protein
MKGKSAGNYEELMVIKKDGKNVNFLITKEGKIIKELLMLADGKDEKILISIQGNIDLKMISKLSRTMKIDGLEDLKEIDKNEE